MAKKSREEETGTESSHTDDLTRASAEEKKVFWDFVCREYRSDPNPPACDEQAIDTYISSLQSLFLSSWPRSVRTLTELVDLLKLQKRVSHLMELLRKRKGEGKWTKSRDFIRSSAQAKRRFWDVFYQAEEFSGTIEAYSEEKADLRIQFFSRLVDHLGPVENLEELTDVADALMKMGIAYAGQDMQQDQHLAEEWDKSDAFEVSLSLPEDFAVLDSMADTIGRMLVERSHEMNSELERIFESFDKEDLLEKGTADIDHAGGGPALKDVVDSAVTDLLKGLVTSFEHGVKARLDQIQQQLDLVMAAQERLEPIADYAAEIAQAHKKQTKLGDPPPMPTMRETQPGRKGYTVERERITGTVDPVLFNLFHEERGERNVTVSRLLDTVLWQRYGKPQLSYEILDEKPQLPQEERERITKPKRKPGRRRKTQN